MIKKVWKAINKVLEPIAKVVSSIVNFILLLIVYLLGVGPVSLIMRLFGKHFLELKKQNKQSNWVEHKLTKQALEKYYRTF